MKKYKCIIFDLDGTMLNTEEMNMIPLQRLIKEELKMCIRDSLYFLYFGVFLYLE